MAHRYNFRYDGISRLLEGMYSAESANALGSYNTWYSYDKNGNPLQIQREAFNAPDNSCEYVDYMSLIYNGNQVKTVRDGGYEFLGSNGYDFKDYSGGADVQYAFDANGSMTHDPYKGTTISYGHLNLPKSIRVDNPISKGTIDYVYSFTGQKLKVTYQEDLKISVNPITGGIVGGGLIPPVTQSNDKRLDYAGNKIYTTGVNRLLKIQPTYLDQILTENGYIKGAIYYFYVRHHLGNNRIVAYQS